MTGSTAIVAIYQASQSIYNVMPTDHHSCLCANYLLQVFDKVAVLYEGRQIYFGDIHAAKTFFVNMGFECPLRHTTADFLTSLTSPAERIVRKGFEGRTPYTPDEFAAMWQKSEDRAQLLREIDEFDRQYPIGGDALEKFKASRKGTWDTAASLNLRPYINFIISYSRTSQEPTYQVTIHTFCPHAN